MYIIIFPDLNIDNIVYWYVVDQGTAMYLPSPANNYVSAKKYLSEPKIIRWH